MYSDYTFIYESVTNSFKSFRRIDMKKNFRFYARLYYDYETQPNRFVFTKQYLNKLNNISATIRLDNGVTETVYSQMSLKSSEFLIFEMKAHFYLKVIIFHFKFRL